jgi:cytoskeletal protein RodZ
LSAHMPTLGEDLKRRREERGISLSDIAEATRIGTRFLRAIETDKYSVLPGGIFTRSFIRAYAREVGMSEEEAVSRYHLQVTGALEEAPPSPDSENQNRPQPAPPVELLTRRPVVARPQPVARPTWPTVIISVAVLLLIGLVAVFLITKFDSSPKAANDSRHARPQTAAERPPAQPPAPAEAAASPAQDRRPSAASSSEAIVIKVEATSGDSWVGYQIDEEKPTSILLRPGESRKLPAAQDQIRLIIGNRQTLRVTVNNREVTYPPDTPRTTAQLTISRNNLREYFP